MVYTINTRQDYQIVLTFIIVHLQQPISMEKNLFQVHIVRVTINAQLGIAAHYWSHLAFPIRIWSLYTL